MCFGVPEGRKFFSQISHEMTKKIPCLLIIALINKSINTNNITGDRINDKSILLKLQANKLLKKIFKEMNECKEV